MSDIRANTISDAAGTGPITLTKQEAVKAHCSWNNQTLTVTILETFNVSSLTEVDKGKAAVNLTNAIASKNKNNTTACFQRTGAAGGEFSHFVHEQSTASKSVVETFVGTHTQDCRWVGCYTIGDLA